ncbi:unnamed protein product [Protopolystoma xenopodis]|uniref:Vacuolar protein sorting-associated protein 13 VPS13 adaptor binding domain-containing protein n=1 Tax=Protopolystoma xenopodis TaxID=117903 RepID=A0A3S5ATA9_9PLAT|nr:unnamed protein product [Protopolystoma xenopodis]
MTSRDAFPTDPIWNPETSDGEISLLKAIPGHHFILGPLVRITNLLPCELTFFFKGTGIRGRVGPSQEASVHQLGSAEIITFGIMIDGFLHCDCLEIPPNTYSQTMLMQLLDTFGRPLELQVSG